MKSLAKFSSIKKIKTAENLESPKIQELKDPITPHRKSNLLQMYSIKNKRGLRSERILSAHDLYGSRNKLYSIEDDKDGDNIISNKNNQKE